MPLIEQPRTGRPVNHPVAVAEQPWRGQVSVSGARRLLGRCRVLDAGCAMLIDAEYPIDHGVQHECEGNCDLAG